MIKIDVRRVCRPCERGLCLTCSGEDTGMFLDFVCACDCQSFFDPLFPVVPHSKAMAWLDPVHPGAVMPYDEDRDRGEYRRLVALEVARLLP